MLTVTKAAGAELVIYYGREKLVIQNLGRGPVKLGIQASTRFVVEQRRRRALSGRAQ